MTDDLAAFLNARLDEDEAAAVAAAEADRRYGGRPNWSAFGNIVIDAGDPDWAAVDLSPCFEDASVGAHIVRHDPARVLREVEAKRHILIEHETRNRGEGHDGRPRCHVCTAIANGQARRFAAPCPTLRMVASIYSDHPDYREDWKP